MSHTTRQVVRPPWVGGAVLGSLFGVLISLPVHPSAFLSPGQESKSAPVAKQLIQALEAAKLDSIAAADPADPGTYVAALYIPGAQLLVVTAKYTPALLLDGKILNKDYRDVYMDLQSASVAGTKIFIMDLLADGLVANPENDQPSDIWEQGKKTVLFDRKKSEMSEEEYAKTFADADQRYARMLSLLVTKARPGSGSQQ